MKIAYSIPVTDLVAECLECQKCVRVTFIRYSIILLNVMYDIAPRTQSIKSSTGPNVGPSTYVICSTTHHRKKNVTPFLSSAPRTPSFVGKACTDVYYDTETCHKIRGGSSIQNKSQRFVYNESDTPPPTKYNPRVPKCKKCPKMDPSKPKLYVCRVPYVCSDAKPPSIPGKRDENGYDLDNDGNLIKIPPDVVDSQSALETELPTFCCEQYKGCKWSQRTSLRFDPKADNCIGPGPAAYDLNAPQSPRSKAFEEYREMARLFTFIPRYIEAQGLKTRREALPGPGDYDVPATCPKRNTCQSKSVRPLPFISGASRFSKNGAPTPSPDQYKICDCSRKKKQFSTKCAPFGFDSPRFRPNKAAPTPGPASYSIKSPLHEKLRSKQNPFSLVRPAFSQMAKRDISFEPRDAAFTPSPADYPELKKKKCEADGTSDCDDDDAEDQQESTEIYSSVFMSAVPRFPGKCRKEDLGPSSYHITDAFNKNRSRTSWNTGNAAFNASALRTISLGERIGGPGPTDYCVLPETPCGGCPFKTSPRFESDGRCVPGPGTYMIHPSFGDSCYKSVGTKNLRLKENVLHKKLRLAPKETRDEFLANIKRKKKLNWFVKRTLDDDERLINKIEELFGFTA